MGLVKLGLITIKDHPSLHKNGPEITWVFQFRNPFLKSLMNITIYESI